MLNAIVDCEQASTTDVDKALATLRANSEKEGAGGLIEFLALHTVGQKLVSHAESTREAREVENEKQEAIDKWARASG